ncbi:hypothetical protein [Burkholderia diffusa]|uniref:hypothetical protein n=1 Tax=Burkholderia diffusa TaxID=488732 RepID=UPI0012D94250|nr:hypothetical protein [Burkholderia diffusa]
MKTIASKDILDLLSRHFDFDTRCVAYTVALSVLDEAQFPAAQGQPNEMPEHQILRRT